MRFLLILLLNLVVTSSTLMAQAVKRNIHAMPANEPIKVDGYLDEQSWNSAAPATGFVQRIPVNGQPARFISEVRMLYDNSGLYVGALMHDPSPDSVLTQLGLRDSDGLNADNFILVLSPFNDGINAFCFMVTASDVQSDFKLTGSGGEDFSWDAVWLSKARVTDNGWIVEMKIPYSAIRFPKSEVQEWGLNYQREIRRYREVVTWNLVDSKVSGYVNQCGLLMGIKDVKPPLRLSLTPYVSGYLEKNPGIDEWQFSYNFGADLKYGINESFTLDMTLIPDFGQVPSDDRIFNFSPFEIRYEEKRQFFTEGTEMFNKGGIFYSRRVGAFPRGFDAPYEELDSNEKVTENPQQTRLINATKISGRTTGGLGIGVFNGMSANTWATITDTITGESRRVLTQGFTNYNMIVLDQNLKNNSYLDFLNTNYYIPDEGYMANVTGTDFKFANKAYTYAFSGNIFVSQKYIRNSESVFGPHYKLSFGKISGNFKYSVTQLLETDQYDPNDMGFNPVNNRFNNSISFQYNIYDPFWKVLNWYNYFEVNYNMRYDGFKYTEFSLFAETNTTTKQYLTLGSNFETQPFGGNDYYEPRVPGWMYKSPAYGNLVIWFSSDYRKTFALDGSIGVYLASSRATSGFGISLEPRLRLGNRFFMTYDFTYNRILNDVGYVTDSVDNQGNEVIIFGRRDRLTIENVLEANYMITSSMSIDIRGRHYWVRAPYYSFFQLQSDGSLQPVTYDQPADVDFNLFNIDLSYIWNFAPGSQVSFVWKNAIVNNDQEIANDFFYNLGQTLTSPASNSFSVRFIYYLDAQYFARKKPRKTI